VATTQDVYDWYPERLFSGLSKLGGIVTLFKMLSLFTLLHSYLFEI
jgi:hypothetical protein